MECRPGNIGCGLIVETVLYGAEMWSKRYTERSHSAGKTYLRSMVGVPDMERLTNNNGKMDEINSEW